MKTDKDHTSISEKTIKSTNLFPVVGIGASAGGLEAFKKLLHAIPENSGMAYVLVQHLDPKHESLLPELLQKVTEIPVLEIIDDVKVKPDHIYIIPSNKMLVANDGVLKLSDRPVNTATELNLPIDLFFKSLAEIHESHSIGVVLSGTASDGTKGLKAIKDHGGITFAQDEASAAFDGMPKNAVLAGVVDFILPPEEIPRKLLDIKQDIYRNDEELLKMPRQDDDAFKQIFSLLRIRKGTDFTWYKQTTIHRRILRRIALNRNEGPAAYLLYLRENKAEQDILYQDLLISVTSFFRDPKVFDNLCDSVFPYIEKNKDANDPIRVWIAGCSTGQEAYSVAICMKEFLGDRMEKVQIFATDLSEPAIVKARTGIYLKNELEGLSPQRLQEFFTKKDNSYQVNKSIREMCVFAAHNFLKDPPFGKIDFLSCRNVLIYMEPYLQKKALTTFHYALNPKGFLLLGKSETANSVPDLFAVAGKTDKLFNRKDMPGKFMHTTTQRTEQSFVDLNIKPESGNLVTDFQKIADEIMLQKYTPAGVVVNEIMEIVQFRGSTGLYLEAPSGMPSHNLLKMAKTGLAFELRNILLRARKENKVAVKENIPVLVNGTKHLIGIEAIPLPNIVEPHYLILFHDAHLNPKQDGYTKVTRLKPDEKDLRIQLLEKELAQTREDMSNIAEDQEAANEELQSANEELQSGSEEMQSMNEELETSKEELQSTNEELTVVNQEMIDLNEQVSHSRDYAEAIIATIREPLLVLEKDLRVRSANESFYKMFKVNEKQTEGVLIYDLGNKQWDIPELQALFDKVLPEKKMFTGFEVQHIYPGIGERIMTLNAREIIREREDEKLYLLAIEDITIQKQHQLKERELLNKFKNLVMQAPVAICIFRGSKYIIELANEKMIELWGRTREEVIDKPVFEGMPDLGGQGYEELLRDVYTTGKRFVNPEMPLSVLRNGNIEKIFIKLVYEALYEEDGQISGVIAIADETTDLVISRKKMEAQAAMVQDLLMTAPGFVCTLVGPNHVYGLVNERYQQLFGKRIIQGKPMLEALPELKGQGFDKLIDNIFITGEPYVGIDIPIKLARDENLEPELRYFNFSYQPMYDENRLIYAVLVFGYEVTEQVMARNKNLADQKSFSNDLEEKVRQRTLELSEANESLQIKNQEIALSKYNKRFLTEFSEKFSAYRIHNEFFNSLVQFISDTTHLDYVFVGKLEENEEKCFSIQTLAITAYGKIVENINYSLPGGPCEQVIQGTLYSYPENCREIFPNNKTLEQYNVDGYLGYPLFNEGGKAIGLISVMHEKKIDDAETVSSVLKIVAKRAEIELERIKYEEQLEQTNKALQEKIEELGKSNKELQAFSYVSSHDLQEPLRKIKTFSKLILDKENQNLSEQGKDYFNRMGEAAIRMQTLIEDLLAYSQTNTADRKFENTRLDKIVDEVKNELNDIIRAQNVIIETSGLNEAYIIPFQIRQLFNNLISNSIKFSRPDVQPHIIIKSKIASGSTLAGEDPEIPASKLSAGQLYTHISVSDNGIGFSAQYSSRIFEVFQRLHGKEEYAGTGIGLSIVKKIVENHNGYIDAVGDLQKGATFNIYIPSHENF